MFWMPPSKLSQFYLVFISSMMVRRHSRLPPGWPARLRDWLRADRFGIRNSAGVDTRVDAALDRVGHPDRAGPLRHRGGPLPRWPAPVRPPAPGGGLASVAIPTAAL